MARSLANRLIVAGAALLALGLPAVALAGTSTVSTSVTSTTNVTTSSTATSAAEGRPSTSATEGSSTSSSSSSSSSSTTQATTTGGVPEARAQAPQHRTGGRSISGSSTGGPSSASRKSRHPKTARGGRRPHTKGPSSAAPPPGVAGRNGAPPLPFSLRTPVSGLPSVFLEAFDVPPFLLPIYQAAGIAYGVPWQVLAAINEVESDYGRDLNVSSAGAEGWMQFLPVEWRQWGVDAGSSGYADPYNPADAIFAAARYLSAAGGSAHIRAAVYAYNHSQSYVESVMLRAQLLWGMPPEMLGAVTDLAEARFPVHAPARFRDGFTANGASGIGHTTVGTTIYSEPGAPVIAVKDGTIAAIGDSARLGLHVTLRDAYGDLFTYADLGEIASIYPVLAPRGHGAAGIPARSHGTTTPPGGPATAGVQPHPPLSLAGVEAGFTFGPIVALQGTSSPARPRSATAPARVRSKRLGGESFLEGPERVYLRALRPGATVIAGTVLGHLAAVPEAHVLFQIRPAGALSPPIDPKPLLDSWVALEETGIFAAKGESPFLDVSPTAGQALLESRGQLQQQVLRDRGLGLTGCERGEVQAGRIDRRVLASIELLSVSGLRPAVAGLGCGAAARAAHNGLAGYAQGDAFDVTAVNGVPVAGHAAPGEVADLLERRLLQLQGTMKPSQLAGPVTYLEGRTAVSLPASRVLVHVAFAPAGRSGGGAATTSSGAAATIASAGPALVGSEWTALDERLAEISDPGVSQERSSAAIPDGAGAQEGLG